MSLNIISFLRSRDVSESTLERLQNDKVDAETVRNVDDHILANYIETLGDRVALRNYCDSRAAQGRKQITKRKHLFEALRKKLSTCDNNIEQESVIVTNKDSDMSNSIFTTKINRKETRKIFFGWIHNSRPVRERTGGGIRSIDISQKSSKADLLEVGKMLFFPNGSSSKGLISDFDFDIFDVKETPLPENINISDVHDPFHTGKLTFYLSSSDAVGKAVVRSRGEASNIGTQTTQTPVHDRTYETIVSRSCDTDSLDVVTNSICSSPNTITDLPVIIGIRKNSRCAVTSMSGNHDIIDSTQASSHDTDSTADILHLDLELPLKDLTEDELNLDMALFQNDELSSLSMNPDILDSEPTFIDLGTPTVQMRQNAVVSNVQTVTTLRLHRGNVLNEMIRYYEDTDIDAHIEIKMVYPNGMVEAGEDNGGVLRDALTEFWTTFYETRTIGNTIKVPALMHIMSNAQWIACGRILVMGFKQQGYLPIQLAEPFMNSVLYENYKHTDHVDSLLQSFQQYVPDIEKDLIKVILNDFESADKDELMDFLSAHDVRVLVNKKNVSDVLCQVAHKELIQAPSFVARCSENTIGQELVPFMTETYQEHCKAIIPTTRKVLNMLHFPDELNNDQSTVSRHLKNYIKSLSQDKLQYFLRFVTGSDLIIGKQIQIRFVKLSEFQRRPVAHTCGCVLEIPTNYDTYVEFRSEFNSVLNSGVLNMDFV